MDEALHEVITGLAARADAERQKEKPYQDLWEASEGGLRSLLSETDRQMKDHAHSCANIIKERFKLKKVSNKLWDLIKALPFAMWELRTHIDETQGMSCCADKAREMYYQEVLAEIKRIQEEKSSGGK